MKKIYMMMMLVLAGMMAMAQTSVWNGGRTIWSRGTGTESDPYLLESAEHLAYFAYVVNKGYDTQGMYFKLTTDIDLNGSEDQPWIPIGLGDRWFSDDGCDRKASSGWFYDGKPYFRGHFDGGNHSIYNIYVDDSYAGLFGKASGTPNNLPAVIENVFVVSGTIAGGTCGGIVGYGNANLEVFRCWNSASINGHTVGGIVGSSVNYVVNCYNTGDLIGESRVGGIVGEIAGVIEECYNSGTIVGGATAMAGGILGRSIGGGGGSINNCYNSGRVSAIGGEEGNFPAAGGLFGLGKVSITNSYNVGEVICTNHSGCLIGLPMSSCTVENCYYLNTCAESEFGTSSSEDEMRSQEFVNLLNNENPNPVWALDANQFNNGFPVLAHNVCLVEVSVNPAEGGVAEGDGIYGFGASVTLTATANEGYTFVNWTKDGEEVSTDSLYSFTVTEAGSYVANFSLNSYEVVVTAQPEEYGSVTGSGTYQHGSTVTVTAVPNTDYHLEHWTKNGDVVSDELSYSFVVTEDCQLVAHLEYNKGVEEANAAVLKVYPNPTHGQFTVEGSGVVVVRDLLGQTLVSREIDGQGTLELPQGVYFVTLGHVTQIIIVE